MCGRFIQSSRSAIYARVFGTGPGVQSINEAVPRFNVAPSQAVLLVREPHRGRRELAMARWGLIPAWSRGPDSRYSMINARAESVYQKPAYRGPFRYRRCLVPADGFYEWKSAGKVKQPYCIRRKDESPIALGCLWDRWSEPDGEELDSCSIIVTAAEGILATVHDRMPLMLSADTWDDWLDPGLQDPSTVQSLMAHKDQSELLIYPVSRRVNSPANDDAELMSPCDADTP